MYRIKHKTHGDYLIVRDRFFFFGPNGTAFSSEDEMLEVWGRYCRNNEPNPEEYEIQTYELAHYESVPEFFYRQKCIAERHNMPLADKYKQTPSK